MKLMTATLERETPKFLSQENVPLKRQVVRIHYFLDNCDWYVLEYNKEDLEFFGFVSIGYGYELGYFGIEELEAIRNKYGLGVERDLHFEKQTVEELGLDRD